MLAFGTRPGVVLSPQAPRCGAHVLTRGIDGDALTDGEIRVGAPVVSG